MATLDDEDDYLEAEYEHLNDVVVFPPDVQEAIDKVSSRRGLGRCLVLVRHRDLHLQLQ